MTKKILYHILFIFDVIALLLIFLQTFLAFNGMTRDDFETFNFWRTNITYFVIIFWIWNIVIWSQRDKKISRFFALIFLPGIYTLFYYRHVLKNNWLDNNENSLNNSHKKNQLLETKSLQG